LQYRLIKILLISIISLTFAACISKQGGKYHTKYSYHPYYDLYGNKMSGSTPTQKIKQKKMKNKKIAKKQKLKSKHKFNESDFFPSNIPAQ